jgi:putative aminopeptidase FrvX
MNEKFLEKYVNSYSPSGSEMQSQKLWIDEVKEDADAVIVENYGNAIARIHSDSEKTILIEAHVDEVSYRVNLITENGLIYVIKNGNADHQVAPSSRVKIHTEKGLVDGVFGWPAIHTRSVDTSKETLPTVENIFIDCGVDSKKELTKLGVRVGCLVTYPSNFQILGNYYTGKGLDNKIGGYILSEVLKRFKDDKSDLYQMLFANVVQEEVGLRGAHMICQNYKPDLAIVIDVTHDTSTPMMNPKKSGSVYCGGGPILTLSTVTHPNFVSFIEETASKNKIKYQRKSLGKSTGTDADNYASHGIITALVSIPMRYMHTKVEMVHARDVEKAIDLIYNVLKNLKNDMDFSFFKK